MHVFKHGNGPEVKRKGITAHLETGLKPWLTTILLSFGVGKGEKKEWTNSLK